MTEFINDFSRETWEQNYKYGDEESVDDTFRRVASHLASKEKNKELWAEKFFSVLSNFVFLLGGRITSNAGTGLKGNSYINCFVSGPGDNDQDSMEGILRELRNQALILKSEGGYGFCIDFLRPRGSIIHGIGNQTPGAVRFLDLWNAQSDVITAGSGKDRKSNKEKRKIRKGAQLVSMSCWHPDIIEFIRIKRTPGKLTHFNMSVLCTDLFMKHVKEHLPWTLVYPNYEKYKEEYKEHWDGDLSKWIDRMRHHDDAVKVYHEFPDAHELWDIIMDNAYNRNEPGVIFIDTVNRFNNLYFCENIKSCNPCGEQFLPVGGCCLLGSINLTQFLDLENKNWNYKKLDEYIPIIVRMMDNVNDLTYVPLPEQEMQIKDKRRIGMGILGYASSLMLLRLRYGSKRSLEITEELMLFIKNEAYKCSTLLAEEKEMFPAYKPQEYQKSEFIKQLDKKTQDAIKTRGMRNSHLLSIQPTANSSLFANNTSTGFEPIFTHVGIRTVVQPCIPEGMEIPQHVDWEQRIYEGSGWDWNREGDESVLAMKFNDEVWKFYKDRGLTKECASKDYAVSVLEEQGAWDKEVRWAVSVDDLSLDDHIKTMEVFARHVDSAISKTINLPEDFSYDEFKSLYMRIFDTGVIKGCTIYRKGTTASVLSNKSILENAFFPVQNINKVIAPQRPKTLPCDIHRLEYKGNKWLVFVGLLNRDPYEVFALRQKKVHLPRKLKTGHLTKVHSQYNLECEDDFILEDVTDLFGSDEEEVITRLISTALRHGVDIEFIIDQLMKAQGTVVSFNKVIARTLKKYLSQTLKVIKCNFCGSKNMKMLDGCFQCSDCGKGLCD